MNSLINVSEGYISNLGPLGPLLHVEKFVDGGWWEGGGGGRPSLVFTLVPSLTNSFGVKFPL